MTTDAILATLVLGGMCGLMWFLARVARRRMGVGTGTIAMNSLRVVGKRPLDQKAAIYVVEIAGGRHILVGAGTDGTVTKLDDISLEEYAVMSADTPAASKPKLRVARSNSPIQITGENASAPTTDDAGPEDAKFASVGESFQHFLGKAKQARDDRKDRRASGE